MLPENKDKVLAMLADDALVLDIGGWARPFGRADYVVDALPYETRGIGGSDDIGGERFASDTWIVADVNRPLPFPDKKFDFVTCSHTLEDIRDPMTLCAELMRVAKAGYIETPSRSCESVYGVEGHYVGLYHHRWLVEMSDNKVTFRPKVHVLHGSRRFYLPREVGEKMSERDKVTWLFWEGDFAFEEVVIISKYETERELADFRRRVAPPSRLKLAMEDPKATVVGFVRRHAVTRRLASAVLRREVPQVPPDPWAIAPELRLH